MGYGNHRTTASAERSFVNDSIPATLTEAEELAAMYFIVTGQTPDNKEGQLAVEEMRVRLAAEGGIALNTAKPKA